MEYSALGTVEAADSGGALPYNSSEEREGREPDGLRFDRERARRLWEAVSGAQPVGREEGESEDLRGSKSLAHPLVSLGAEEARVGNADQPPGLRSHPLAPGPPPCVTRPGLLDSCSPAGPGYRGPAPRKIEAAAPSESGLRSPVVKGLLMLTPLGVGVPPPFSSTRAQLFPKLEDCNSYSCLPGDPQNLLRQTAIPSPFPPDSPLSQSPSSPTPSVSCLPSLMPHTCKNSRRPSYPMFFLALVTEPGLPLFLFVESLLPGSFLCDGGQEPEKLARVYFGSNFFVS